MFFLVHYLRKNHPNLYPNFSHILLPLPLLYHVYITTLPNYNPTNMIYKSLWYIHGNIYNLSAYNEIGWNSLLPRNYHFPIYKSFLSPKFQDCIDQNQCCQSISALPLQKEIVLDTNQAMYKC